MNALSTVKVLRCEMLPSFGLRTLASFLPDWPPSDICPGFFLYFCHLNMTLLRAQFWDLISALSSLTPWWPHKLMGVNILYKQIPTKSSPQPRCPLPFIVCVWAHPGRITYSVSGFSNRMSVYFSLPQKSSTAVLSEAALLGMDLVSNKQLIGWGSFHSGTPPSLGSRSPSLPAMWRRDKEREDSQLFCVWVWKWWSLLLPISPSPELSHMSNLETSRLGT